MILAKSKYSFYAASYLGEYYGRQGCHPINTTGQNYTIQEILGEEALSYRLDCSDGYTIQYYNYLTEDCEGEPSVNGQVTIPIKRGRAQCEDTGGIFVKMDALGWTETIEADPIVEVEEEITEVEEEINEVEATNETTPTALTNESVSVETVWTYTAPVEGDWCWNWDTFASYSADTCAEAARNTQMDQAFYAASYLGENYGRQGCYPINTTGETYTNFTVEEMLG